METLKTLVLWCTSVVVPVDDGLIMRVKSMMVETNRKETTMDSRDDDSDDQVMYIRPSRISHTKEKQTDLSPPSLLAQPRSVSSRVTDTNLHNGEGSSKNTIKGRGKKPL
jgi:hypothetical protein